MTKFYQPKADPVEAEQPPIMRIHLSTGKFLDVIKESIVDSCDETATSKATLLNGSTVAIVYAHVVYVEELL